MEANNAQAMREALAQTRQWLTRLFEGGNDDSDISHIMGHLQHCRNACASALAAPPRNCDTFGGDFKMLRMAWHDWTGSPSGQNPDGTVKLTFSEWLLEKAVRHDI